MNEAEMQISSEILGEQLCYLKTPSVRDSLSWMSQVSHEMQRFVPVAYRNIRIKDSCNYKDHSDSPRKKYCIRAKIEKEYAR